MKKHNNNNNNDDDDDDDNNKREMARLWKLKSVVIVPVVINALGTISHWCRGFLGKGNITSPIELLQKVCLLGTARILRKVMDTYGHRKWLDVQLQVPVNITELCSEAK